MYWYLNTTKIIPVFYHLLSWEKSKQRNFVKEVNYLSNHSSSSSIWTKKKKNAALNSHLFPTYQSSENTQH